MELLIDEKVKLFNGTEVPWEIFARWSAHKQMMNLTPTSEGINYGPSHCEKMRKIVKAQYESGARPKPGNFGGSNGQAKPIVTPAGTFSSLREAVDHYKIRSEQMKVLMRERPTEFYWAAPKENDAEVIRRKKGVAVNTPDGQFKSIKAAARHFNVSERTIKTWIRGMRADEFSYA